MLKMLHLTILASEIVRMLDCGKHKQDVAYIKTLIKNEGDIFEHLEKTFAKEKIDLSYFQVDDRSDFIRELYEMTDINESRKFGIENDGLCLLLAYILEMIQRRESGSTDRDRSLR